MANYTQEEIDAAVKKYIRTDTRTTRDPLGPRDTDQVFAEVMEFISSALVFDPNSIFYLLYLIKNRINQDLTAAITTVIDLKQAVLEVGGYTKKVTSTTLLSDAASALLEADRLITQRRTIASPQFSRYEDALSQFVDVSLAPNMRRLVGSYPDTYEVVRPPQAAQSAIKSDISSLRTMHVTVLEETAQLAQAFTEFLAQNLPILAIQTSVQKVQVDLKSLQAEFDAGTEAEAIEMTRDAYLRITAGRSVITNLVSMRDPTSYRMRGVASTSDRAQAASPSSSSTPGQVVTAKSAPYHIVPSVSDQLNLLLDGVTPAALTLVPPAPAKVVGANSDQTPFQINASATASISSSSAGPYTVPGAPDNVFDIYVDGVGYRAVLTSGSRTAAEVAVECWAATRIDGGYGYFTDVCWPTSFDETLGFQKYVPGPGSVTVGSQAANAALGFTNGQTSQGATANNILRLFVDDELEVLVTLTAGSRTAAEVAADITAASTRIHGSTVVLGMSEGLAISSAAYGAQSRIQVLPTSPVHQAAMATLGFTDGQSARSSYLGIDTLYSALNATPGVAVTRSSTSLASGLAGTTVKVGSDYILRLEAGSIPAGFTIGDCLLIKAGENAGYYHVLSFTDVVTEDTITVDRPFPVVTGEGAQNQSWELRRDVLTIGSVTSGLSSSVGVQAGTANDALGLVEDTYRGKTSGVRVLAAGKALNFARNNVVAGDVFQLSGPTLHTTHTITEVSDNGYQIEVTPQVPNELTGHYYYIEGASAKAYASFISALQSWQTDLGASVFKTDILDLERKLNPLLYNMHPTAAAVNDAMRSLEELWDPDNKGGLYYVLQVVLDSYFVSKVSLVDAMLDMLLEKGLRRGHDLLLLGQFANFLAVTRDTGSYGGNMMEKMRKVAQNDVPVSRGLDGGQGESQLTGSFTDVDYTREFSDGDDERAIAETDDIPEPGVDEQILRGV